MIALYSEEQVLGIVTRLTRSRLVALVEAEAVVPTRQGAELTYRQADIARLELLCDLIEFYDIDDEALAMVISLIDQLHAARRDLHALAAAVLAEPAETRARIAAALAAAEGDVAD